MAQSSAIDLVQLFGAVATNLAGQKDALNKADAYNNDHGDNMVGIFETITQAVQEKSAAAPADQLAYASDALRRSKSGSAQAYANGLTQAAEQFQGEGAITLDNANILLQTLLGGGQAAVSEQPQASTGGNLLGALLGSLTGNAQKDADSGLDVGDLLNAGIAFMNAKQQGDNTAEAAISALISASPLGESQHRVQSSAVVTNTIMQVLSAMSQER